MTTGISGIDEEAFNQPDAYAANIADLTNVIFLTLKNAGVEVEKVTILSVTFSRRVALRRRLVNSQASVVFIVSTNTATAPVANIANTMSTALTTNLKTNLKASPNVLLKAAIGVTVEAILVPTTAPTAVPTPSPTVAPPSLWSFLPYFAGGGGSLILIVVLAYARRRGWFVRSVKVVATDKYLWDDDSTVISQFSHDSDGSGKKKKSKKEKLTRRERMWKSAAVIELDTNKVVPMNKERGDDDDESLYHIFSVVSPDFVARAARRRARKGPERKQPKAETCRFHFDGKPQNAYLRGKKRCIEARIKAADGVTMLEYCERHCKPKSRKFDATRGRGFADGEATTIVSLSEMSQYHLGLDDDSLTVYTASSADESRFDQDDQSMSDMSEIDEPAPAPVAIPIIRGLRGRVTEIVVQTKG